MATELNVSETFEAFYLSLLLKVLWLGIYFLVLQKTSYRANNNSFIKRELCHYLTIIFKNDFTAELIKWKGATCSIRLILKLGKKTKYYSLKV